MARSEAQHQSEDCHRVRSKDSDCEKDGVKALARRLRSDALSGLSRKEQNILMVLPKCLAKLRQILLSKDACGARDALFSEYY